MVYKRDGRSEVFKPEKIQNAVLKAFYEVDGEETERAKEIAERISTSISEIQRILEWKKFRILLKKKSHNLIWTLLENISFIETTDQG